MLSPTATLRAVATSWKRMGAGRMRNAALSTEGCGVMLLYSAGESNEAEKHMPKTSKTQGKPMFSTFWHVLSRLVRLAGPVLQLKRLPLRPQHQHTVQLIPGNPNVGKDPTGRSRQLL
jgi:hypothetical protein